jgi:hypothetical protein
MALKSLRVSRSAPRAELPTSPRRGIAVWDWLGLTATVSVGVVVAAGMASPAFQRVPPYPGLFRVLLASSVALVATTLVGIAVTVRRRSIPVLDVPRRLFESWSDPARPWLVFALGVAIAIPVVALHTRFILLDSDSARLLASINYVEHHGFGYVVNSQTNIFPHLVLTPVVAIWGVGGAKATEIAFLLLLSGLTASITWRLSGSTLGAAVAALALLSTQSILERARYLPMYPSMLLFGYLGVYLAYRACTAAGRRRWTLAVLAGLALVLSSEAHGLGIAFLVVPAFLLVALPSRRTFNVLVAVFASTAFFYLPRAVMNFSRGGLMHFLTYRNDYWTTKGYLAEIQQNFWRLPSTRTSLVRYPLVWLEHLPRLMGLTAIPVMALAVVAFFLARGNGRWFGIACFGFYMGPAVLRQAPLYPRYFTPLAVGAAIAAGIAVPFLVKRLRIPRWLPALAVPLLVATSMLALLATSREGRARERAVFESPYRQMSTLLTDGKGVIGARPAPLLIANPKLDIYGGQFLTEREFVTFLTWPSDQEVIRMLRARNIGWVYINPQRQFELYYHDIWLVPHYGLRARHVFELHDNPNFCEVFNQAKNVLYRVGGC